MSNWWDEIPNASTQNEVNQENWWDKVPNALPDQETYLTPNNEIIAAPAGTEPDKINYLDKRQNFNEPSTSFIGYSSVKEEKISPYALSKLGLASEFVKGNNNTFIEDVAAVAKSLPEAQPLGIARRTIQELPPQLKKTFAKTNLFAADWVDEAGFPKVAEILTKKANKHLKEQELKIDYIWKDIENNAANNLVKDLATGVRQVATQVGAGLGGVPVKLIAGATVLQQFPDYYEELDSTDFSTLEKTLYSLGITTAVGAVEAFTLNKFLSSALKPTIMDGLRKNITKGITLGAITQGAQEATQQSIEEFSFKALGTRDKTYLEIASDVAYAGLIGSIVGGGVGGVAQGTSYMVQKGKELGLPEEKAQQLAEELQRNDIIKLTDAEGQIINAAEKISKDDADVATYDEVYKSDVSKFMSAIDSGLDSRIIYEELNKGESLDFAIQKAKSTQKIQAEKEKLEKTAQPTENKLPDIQQKIVGAEPELSQKTIDSRVRKLDEEIDNIDNNLDDALNLLKEKEGAGLKTQAVKNKINKLYEARTKLDEERGNLLTAGRDLKKLALQSEDKAGIEKAGTKAKLAKQSFEEKIRAVQATFRKTRSLVKKDIKQAQSSLINIINASNLNADDKGKFLSNVKNVNSTEKLQEILPELEAKISRLQENDRYSQQTNRIEKSLKKIKPKIVSGKLQGKFTADVQNTLNGLKDIVKNYSTENAALTEIQKRLKQFKNGNRPLNEKEFREIRLLQIYSKSFGIETGNLSIDNNLYTDKVNSRLVKEFANEIVQLKRDGITAKEKKLQEIEKQQNDIINVFEKELVKNLKPASFDEDFSFLKSVNVFSDVFRYGVYSWNTFVSKFSNTKLREALGFDKEFRAKEVAINKRKKEINKIYFDAYGLKNFKQINKKKLEDAKQIDFGTYTIKGRQKLVKFSKAEIRKLYMEMQNPDLAERLTSPEGNDYSQQLLDTLFAELDASDLKFINSQLTFYNNYYNEVNKVYRNYYGVDLKREIAYSPIKTENYVPSTDVFDANSYKTSSVAPSSTKKRTDNQYPLQKLSDTDVLSEHIVNSEHFIAFADKMRITQGVIADPNVRSLIKDKYGSGALKAFDWHLEFIKSNGRNLDTTAISNFFNRIKSNLAVAYLGGKIGQIPKQMTSMISFMGDVPPIEFGKNFLIALKNPKKAYDVIMSSEVFKERYDENAFSIDYQQLIESDRFKKLLKRPTVENALMLPTKLGDGFSVVFGGYSQYLYLTKKQNLSHEDAIKQVEITAIETQQSTRLDQLSALQVAPSLRLFSLFASNPLALLRKTIEAKLEYQQGKISEQRFIKKALAYWILPAVLFEFVSSGLRTDEEEQEKLIFAAAAGPLSGVPFIGELLYFISSAIIKGPDKAKASLGGVMGLEEFGRDLGISLQKVVKEYEYGGLDNFEDFGNIVWAGKDIIKTTAAVGWGFPVQAFTMMDVLTIDQDLGVDNQLLKAAGFGEAAIIQSDVRQIIKEERRKEKDKKLKTEAMQENRLRDIQKEKLQERMDRATIRKELQNQ